MTPAWPRQLHAWASAVLACRHGGAAVSAAPDWLCPQAVQALELPLRAGAPIQVWLREGVSARALPGQLGSGGQAWPLVHQRAAAMRAQGAAPALTLARKQASGTATALVRDRLAPNRHYLLTCAHVVAPDIATRFGDEVQIELGGRQWPGRLREWQPALGAGCPPSPLDAALVEIDAGVLQQLRTELAAGANRWLPTGLDDRVYADRPVALQRQAAHGAATVLDGQLMSVWSGEVCVDADDFPDYFIQDAIGYRSASPTLPGDSGSAVWAHGDTLLGMHIAGLEGGSTRLGANALMCRVKPALDWFCVKPYTRFDAATLTPADLPLRPGEAANTAPGVPAADDAAEDLRVLTQTLWGEARGEDNRGMEAVAAVILNRRDAAWRGARTVAAVCRTPFQFSCWNANDPNRDAIEKITAQPDASFQRAEQVARRALGLDGPPILHLPAAVRHYHAVAMPNPPPWVRTTPAYDRIGRHLFYAGIA